MTQCDWVFLPLVALALSTLPALGELLSCPDCDNMVSTRAVFCPKCGCPAEFIRKATKDGADASQEEWRTFIVSVQGDQGSGYGVAYQENGTRCILVDQKLLDGATSLTLTTLGTNLNVRYTALELADARGLARLVTDSTNVIYIGMGQDPPTTTSSALAFGVTDAGTTVTSVWVDAETQRADIRTCPDAIPNCVAMCDASTNLLALCASPPHVLGREIEWVRVKPGEYRAQSSLLKSLEAPVGNTPSADTLKTLKQTVWLTRHMKKRADRVIATVMKGN